MTLGAFVISRNRPAERANGQNLSDGDQDELDGLTVQYDDYWFNLRPSNTEPLLRLNIEAANPSLLKEKTEQILQIVRA